MKNLGEAPPETLDMMLAEERSRHRFTWADVEKAKALLGFGRDSVLGVDIEDADDDFVIHAWKDAMKRVWREPDGASQRIDLIDAFKIIADLRGSAKLQASWERGKGSGMTLDTAYSTLDIPKDVDETMLIAIYNMRVRIFGVTLCSHSSDKTTVCQVMDQPSQSDRMREAMSVIAEANDSERLRKFLETGADRKYMLSLVLYTRCSDIEQRATSVAKADWTCLVG